ncbi:hypothetical protein KPL28_02830 [Clostridium algidicarnis]|uniref:hypothetical protein n=1 Tax=Clostridium algidicarnis TaxID=37659 RepID=UPI001C0DD0D2|nr:hypothetical protein [Clostridium algidicarnis]MBU3208569.1 hypothetical protein [Clostridium algidicarnis]
MLRKQLKDLEEGFREIGYTEEMIEAIKLTDGAVKIEEFINNLEEERSCWGE